MRARSARSLSIGAVLLALASGAGAAETWPEAMAAWSQVLERHVDEQGRTDFAALAADPGPLETVVAFIARVSPGSHPERFAGEQAVLAYHINAYNALAMHGVIDEGIPEDFGNFFKRAGFFKFRKIIIGGRKTSLHDYENDVIRPLGEPRIHFALNCMVRDCPRLPREPFRAETLDAQLEAVTREFFNKPKHLRVDHEAETVWVSEILDFYTEDFAASGRAEDLIPYINRYRAEPVPAPYEVRFIDYDWTVNRQP